MIPEQKRILYIDDDEDDRELLLEAIQKVDPEIEVVCAENGLKALDFLYAAKEDRKKLPCLIVLDLNMPYMDGKETFERIKRDPRLQDVPLIVFTSSERPGDKALFSRQGIEYVTKPDDFSRMNSIAVHLVSVCCL